MALTFPLTPGGLEVDVAVNRDLASLLPLWQVGTRPQPVMGRGLIDTGSDSSGVSLAILRQLGASPLTQATTQGVSGSLAVDLYRVSLSVFDARDVSRPWLTHPTIVVMELSAAVAFDALIGLDILRTCRLFLDGPGQQFTLDF